MGGGRLGGGLELELVLFIAIVCLSLTLCQPYLEQTIVKKRGVRDAIAGLLYLVFFLLTLPLSSRHVSFVPTNRNR